MLHSRPPASSPGSPQCATRELDSWSGNMSIRLVTNCAGYDSVNIRSHDLCCAGLGENCCLHTKAVSCIALSIYIVVSSHIKGSISSRRCPCFENDYYKRSYCQLHMCTCTEALEVAEVCRSQAIILSIAHVHMYRSTGGSKAVILSVSGPQWESTPPVGDKNWVKESTRVKLIRVTFGNNLNVHPALYQCCTRWDTQLTVPNFTWEVAKHFKTMMQPFSAN